MDLFITDVTIGDETPFAINHWNGEVTTVDDHGDPVHVARAQGAAYTGSVQPFVTHEDALAYARSLQPLVGVGEDIFVLTNQEFEKSDSPVPHLSYFVAGPARVGTFDPA